MSSTAKLSAKDRIYTLLDDNSFVEIGALVTKRSTDFNMQQMSAPGDGVVTGYGVINDNLVYVYSQDVAALNGTIGEMHAKKITKLYDLAMISNKQLSAEDMTKFVERSNEIMLELTK